jgi:hypothetical protein
MSYVDSYAELPEYRTELRTELRKFTKKDGTLLSEIRQTTSLSLDLSVQQL